MSDEAIRRQKLAGAVEHIRLAQRALRAVIDKLDKTSPLDMMQAGCICEDIVMIAGVGDSLNEWRCP